MTRSWRPDGDPSPAKLVGGVWSRWLRGVGPCGRAGPAGEKQPGRARQPASSVGVRVGVGMAIQARACPVPLRPTGAGLVTKHCGEREIALGGWQDKDLEQCKLSHGACNSLPPGMPSQSGTLQGSCRRYAPSGSAPAGAARRRGAVSRTRRGGPWRRGSTVRRSPSVMRPLRPAPDTTTTSVAAGHQGGVEVRGFEPLASSVRERIGQ